MHALHVPGLCLPRNLDENEDRLGRRLLDFPQLKQLSFPGGDLPHSKLLTHENVCEIRIQCYQRSISQRFPCLQVVHLDTIKKVDQDSSHPDLKLIKKLVLEDRLDPDTLGRTFNTFSNVSHLQIGIKSSTSFFDAVDIYGPNPCMTTGSSHGLWPLLKSPRMGHSVGCPSWNISNS